MYRLWCVAFAVGEFDTVSIRIENHKGFIVASTWSFFNEKIQILLKVLESTLKKDVFISLLVYFFRGKLTVMPVSVADLR